ncbi:MAG: hypothetical protein HWQ38_30100 [Nostoc sp. NMS7]|uniref:hypothetical protein n=1 Tax=Nostoc sp. NMS7 TaxID=2815391 RepID=UPI0025F93A8E|nr:hypothetical protein [Nostoc sp. NMS7]MBN3950491.1 hypothetical protein [Nostoc sp. NMS7]
MSDRLVENLKNKAIACCERVCDVYDGLRLRLTGNLKNKAITCCGRMSAMSTTGYAYALQKTSKIKRKCVVACR